MFTHMETAVRDVMRILNQPGVHEALKDFSPAAYKEMLLPWLNRAAKQIVETPPEGEVGRTVARVARALRRRSGMAFMFMNVANALQQIAGLSISASKVPPSFLARSLTGYLKDPSGMAETVAEASPFMATRMENEIIRMMGDVRDFLINPTLFEQAQNFGAKHGYVLQQLAQNVVDTITWAAAYDHAVQQGHDDKTAIRAADSAVRETQGSMAPEDVAKMETGPAFARMFTQFSTYFNMIGNMLATGVSNADGLTAKARAVGLILLIPAWVSGAIVSLMRGGPEDDDDDGYLDEFLAFLFGEPARTLLSTVPGAGQFVAYTAFDQWDDKRFNDRLSTAPSATMLESAGRAPRSLYNALVGEGSAKAAVRDSLTAITIMTGIPVSALGRPLGYAADVAQDKVDPTGPVDFTRGLITGNASSQSRR
jgi:hypothetical protein